MRRALWLELGPLWPLENWDHWMRLETTAKGRQCIVPEVNRNKNIGEVGANMNKQQFRRYLANMGWNDKEVQLCVGLFGGVQGCCALICGKYGCSTTNKQTFVVCTTHIVVPHTQFQEEEYGDLSYLLHDVYEQFVVDAINTSQVCFGVCVCVYVWCIHILRVHMWCSLV